MKRMDLHIHSSRSDGFVAPAMIARQLADAGLDRVALTDHNVLDGLAELRDGLDGSGVGLINGVELSVGKDAAGEFHLLGYGVDPDSPALRQVCSFLVSRKRLQISRMIERLQGAGVDITAEEVLGTDATRYVGRQALARTLLRKGAVGSPGEAFGRYLGLGGKAYVPMGAVSPEEAVSVVHQAGGVAVLAHPSVKLLDTWVSRLAAAGMDGIEVYRPASGGNQELYSEMVAEDFGMFATGGSDWHGSASEGPLGGFWVASGKLDGFFARPEVN